MTVTEQPESDRDRRKAECERWKEECKVLTEERWYHHRMFEQRGEDLKRAEKELYKVCDHEWERDTSVYEPCGSLPKICRHCRLYRDYSYTAGTN